MNRNRNRQVCISHVAVIVSCKSKIKMEETSIIAAFDDNRYIRKSRRPARARRERRGQLHPFSSFCVLAVATVRSVCVGP